MRGLERFADFVDKVNQKVGRAISFSILLLALVTVYDVTARYVFNSPTIWAYDINVQLFGILILLGVAYVLLLDKHIRIEFALLKAPPKGKFALEMFSLLVIMFVAFLLIWQGGIAGWDAFVNKEKLESIWSPPVFHIKMLFPVAGVLLLFQAMSKGIRYYMEMVKGGHSQP